MILDMKQLQKKGQLQIGDILPLALILVVAGIGVAFGLNVVNDLKDSTLCEGSQTYNATADTCQLSASNTTDAGGSAALNATKDTVTGVAKFSSKFGIIATVIVAAIVIGLLTRFLAPR